MNDSNYGDNNQMTDAGTADFTFDHFGNTASIVNQQAFTYNYDNCMTQIEYLTSEAFDTHEYDGNMRRMRSKLNDATNWTNFIHDELTENLICEYTLISGTFSIKALNTYGLGLISSNRESTIRYFHFDGLGTTYHLSDTSQNVTDSYSYNAFGVPRSSSGSSVNPYRYVGQWGYYDDGAMGSNSGMLLLGVRYYWPAHGRFTTWDPVAAGNRYFYCKNIPNALIDPDGLIPQACTCDKPSNIFSDLGQVYIDCSCSHLLPFIGVLPERDGSQASWGPPCGRWIGADAFFTQSSWMNGQRVMKVHGQTCVVIVCIGNLVITNQVCCNFVSIWRRKCWPTDVHGPSEFGESRFRHL